MQSFLAATSVATDVRETNSFSFPRHAPCCQPIEIEQLDIVFREKKVKQASHVECRVVASRYAHNVRLHVVSDWRE